MSNAEDRTVLLLRFWDQDEPYEAAFTCGRIYERMRRADDVVIASIVPAAALQVIGMGAVMGYDVLVAPSQIDGYARVTCRRVRPARDYWPKIAVLRGEG